MPDGSVLSFWLAAFVLLSGSAKAQMPDVRIRLDARIAYVSRKFGPTDLRLYDPLGRTSSVAFTFYLEPGLRAMLSERLQRIPGDADRGLLEEYYVEDEGIWRLGKQFLPFGSGDVIRENAIAARGDTNLILERLPISVAIADNGPNRQRGVVAKLGRGRNGISAAFGEHFGISPTSLTYIRRPEASPGTGRGWRQMFGANVGRRSGIFTVAAELVTLRDAHSDVDADLTLYDVSASLAPSRYRTMTLGWTRRASGRADFYRLLGSFFVTDNVFFEPMVRYKDNRLFDVSLALNVRF